MTNVDARIFRELMYVYGLVLAVAKPGEEAFYANLKTPRAKQFCLELDQGWFTVSPDADNLRQLIEHAAEFELTTVLAGDAQTKYIGEKQEILDLVVNPVAYKQFCGSSSHDTLHWTKPYSSEVDRRGWLRLQDWLESQP